MPLRLEITTPLTIAVTTDGIISLRAQDASGDFGIRPGHVDLVTVIDAGVVRWRQDGGRWHFGVVRGGVLSVTGGDRVSIACRSVVLGDDLPTLQAQARAERLALDNAARAERTKSAQLHARAIRHLIKGLAHGSDMLGLEEADQ